MSTLATDTAGLRLPGPLEAAVLEGKEVWPVAPDRPPLTSEEVHVWRFVLDLEDGGASRLEAILEPRERERAARFRFRRDRERYVAARGALRQILGRYLDTRPEEVRFQYEAQGKPRLAGESPPGGIRFNLAHSQALAVYAVARGREVGIDVELVRPEVAREGIERRFFSRAEADDLAGTAEEVRPEAFFRCWTSKEAYAKARGNGLSLSLDAFTILTQADGKVRLLAAPEPGETARWSFHCFCPAEGYVSSLAVEGAGWHARFWEHRIR